MTEPVKRVVREVVFLIDCDVEKPNPGEAVLALGIGGKLCETVWNRNSHEFFKAWMPYPSVQPELKEKLYNLYIGK